MSGALLMKQKCAAFIIMHDLIKKKERQLKKTRHYWIKHLYQTIVFFPFAFSRLNDRSKLELFFFTSSLSVSNDFPISSQASLSLKCHLSFESHSTRVFGTLE
jgi:hypothetical protein